MQSDDQFPRIEIRDQDGNLVDPPEGVTYESAFATMPDEPDDQPEPTESDTCVFCESHDWQWVITPRPHQPGEDTVWQSYLVACDVCHQLYSQGHRDQLRDRVKAATGPYWILPELDQLLNRIIAERQR
ncbi:MAG TPA: hypothetical protein VF557_12785 [Jatrophihabitans sp.]|jgi:hypothetical protein|uniref:hypothetical protein n=1 Tax=Jatrophihabitans sp. TaxID=1932789 RepID=UPI002F1BA9ED